MKTSTIKKASGTAFLFYILIAFEFIYMATPFAAYFYSVYRPGIEFLNNYPSIAWLTGFFLPHLAEETKSPAINLVKPAGVVIAGVGFFVFIFCAAQVYYSKIFKKGIVKGGLYKYIRHPQYTAFILCGFGLLLLWPRYLVIIMFITLLFFYYALAKSEEKECEFKFGNSYTDYKNSTGMFLPFNFSWGITTRVKRVNLPLKIICTSGFYISFLLISLYAAESFKAASINSLYSLSSDKEIFVSIFKKEKEEINMIINILNKDGFLDSVRKDSGKQKYINYILPAGMYMSEIPMRKPQNAPNHVFRKKYSYDKIKVIVTEAVLRNPGQEKMSILSNAVCLKPLYEIRIENGRISSLFRLSDKQIRYKNVPEPVF